MPLHRQIETLLPELQAYAGALCDAPHEAQDLVQDSIERVLRAKNAPGQIDHLRPWLFRVLRNLRYDELRKWRVRREYSARERRLFDETPRGGETERVVMTRIAFARLPPESREVLFLVDVAGLKYREAAEVMGVPPGTVMSRLSRARRALLNIVAGKEEQGRKKERDT
ncbi:RNA polymerase sigma factor [Limimaricola sp.]|uniref:RNA polymerase sigma factor n=1 Tax=Limimaricola sp. TaxID=2211665 RepID=UPI0040597883